VSQDTTNRKAADSTNRKALGLAFFIVFLDLLGASILLPVIPYIVRVYRPDALTVGWLSLSFSRRSFWRRRCWERCRTALDGGRCC